MPDDEEGAGGGGAFRGQTAGESQEAWAGRCEVSVARRDGRGRGNARRAGRDERGGRGWAR